MIHLDRGVCGNLDAALQRVCLEPSSLGGFASSTIVGLNTCRYHGLLVIATRPQSGRMIVAIKTERDMGRVRYQRC